jgi:hypothetical protein
LPVVTRECMELMHRGVKSAVGISERRYEGVSARMYGVLYYGTIILFVGLLQVMNEIKNGCRNK